MVLKILLRAIAHKSELGGVKVGLTAEEVAVACAAMLDWLRAAATPTPEGFLVQERVRGGIQMILGFHAIRSSGRCCCSSPAPMPRRCWTR